LLLELEPYRSYDLMPKDAAGRVADRVLRGFERTDRTYNVAEADTPSLARQAVAAGWAADPKQDLVPHQLLQYRLEIPARDPLALSNLRRSHWHLAAVVGDVQHCLDCEEQFLGQPNHVVEAAIPTGKSLLSQVSRRTRARTSRLGAGRSETAFLSAFPLRKCRYNRKFRARDTGKDELGNAVAGLDPYA